ncbi:MAG: hypothetical protein ACLFR2_04245 [Candidatus Kapaibacterium sp.]
MNIKKFLLAAVFLAAGLILYQGCETFKEIKKSLDDLKRLEFKLESVDSFRLAGVSLNDKSKLKDLSISDGLKLTNAFRSNKLPANFTLNVGARNPNDGSGQTRQTSATITSLDYRLIIDNKMTINGDIGTDFIVPGTGNATIIPLNMQLDLYDFFDDKGYESLINLALAIGGVNGSPARIKLDARPTVKTSLGPITYPGRITIVDQEWKSK